MNTKPILLSCLLLVGCAKHKDEPRPLNQVIIGGGQVSQETPDFGVETPYGYSRLTYHGVLDSTANVNIQPDSNKTLMVYIKHNGFWFKLGHLYSGAFYYQDNGDSIHYVGTWTDGKEYCIYEFIPVDTTVLP